MVRIRTLVHGSFGGAALLLSGACATRGAEGEPAGEAPAAEAPRAPLDVRVSEMSPEVIDRIAERVAARIAAAPGGAPRPVVEVRAAPAVAAAQFVPPAPSAARAARGPGRPPAPPPALTDAEWKDAAKSVELAIDWLARTQSADGTWSSSAGGGEAGHDVGVTGLALLAFLANGDTHQMGAHRETVLRGLRGLVARQDPEGCIGPRTNQHFMYDHMYATVALTEAYGMSQSALFKAPAQNAVNFVLRAQNPYLGWRYGIRDGDNDTSVTGLAVMVLASAKQADLQVDDAAFRGALAWFDKMTEPEFGRTGYQQRGGPPARTMEGMRRFPADRSEALTAVAMTARVWAGADPAKDEWIAKGARLLAAKPPVWDDSDGSTDLYYWYWGTLAMLHAGREAWQGWVPHLVRTLPPHQRRDEGSPERGSWDPADPWGATGGRVYSTAMACLSMQTALRSLSPFSPPNRESRLPK